MKKVLFVFIIVSISASINAQSTSNAIFSKEDRINVLLSEHSDCYYTHEIKKGQSLYALSKIFDVPLQNLYDINKLKKGAPISIGQSVKIPIKDQYLFKGVSLEGLKYGHYIPVYYTTKSKDNLFRISRIYFNQPTEDLIKRNKLENNNLSLGQDILVGWFPIEKKNPKITEDEFVEDFEITEPYPRQELEDGTISIIDYEKIESNPLQTIDSEQTIDVCPVGFNLSLLGSLKYSKSMKEIKKSEVANWDKSMPDNGTVYVLHKNAVIDSYIEMYNPILKRSVRAKVIGRIPYGAYTSDVNLVLSPRAAILLSALDSRFKVETKALILDK